MERLEKIPEEDRKHYMHCEYCKQYFDMRELGEVFLHAEGDCKKEKQKPKIDYSGSQRVGDPDEFLNDENRTKLDLN